MPFSGLPMPKAWQTFPGPLHRSVTLNERGSLLVRREVIDKVGLFNPRYFHYYEEVVHCLSAKRAGWDVVFYPDTTVIHLGGESAKSEGDITLSGRQIKALQIESELLYFRKNHGVTGV